MHAYTHSNAHIYRKKFGSQTCNLWTDAAAADGRGRKEDARRKTIKVCEKEVCNVFRLRRIEKWALAKAAAAPSGQKRNQYVPATVVKKPRFKVKIIKTCHASSNLGNCVSEKSRSCGAKQVFKSKCQKRLRPGAILDVELLKKCARLWREARSEVKEKKHRGHFGK